MVAFIWWLVQGGLGLSLAWVIVCDWVHVQEK